MSSSAAAVAADLVIGENEELLKVRVLIGIDNVLGPKVVDFGADEALGIVLNDREMVVCSLLKSSSNISSEKSSGSGVLSPDRAGLD